MKREISQRPLMNNFCVLHCLSNKTQPMEQGTASVSTGTGEQHVRTSAQGVMLILAMVKVPVIQPMETVPVSLGPIPQTTARHVSETGLEQTAQWPKLKKVNTLNIFFKM